MGAQYRIVSRMVMMRYLRWQVLHSTMALGSHSVGLPNRLSGWKQVGQVSGCRPYCIRL